MNVFGLELQPLLGLTILDGKRNLGRESSCSSLTFRMPEQDFLEGHIHPQGPASHSLCCHLLDTSPSLFTLHRKRSAQSCHLQGAEWLQLSLVAREHLLTIHAHAVQQDDCLCNQMWSCFPSQPGIGGFGQVIEFSYLTCEMAIIFPPVTQFNET